MPWIDHEKHMDMMDGLHERDILAGRVKDMGQQIKFWQDCASYWRDRYLMSLRMLYPVPAPVTSDFFKEDWDLF